MKALCLVPGLRIAGVGFQLRLVADDAERFEQTQAFRNLT